MRLVPETLARALAHGLAPAWLVAGDEPLQVGEAADAIRARARSDGYTGRDVLFADKSFDWGRLRGELGARSLFDERRILELRLPQPKPGIDGSRALVAGMLSSSPPTCSAFSTRGKGDDCLGVETRSAGFCAISPCSIMARTTPAVPSGRRVIDRSPRSVKV